MMGVDSKKSCIYTYLCTCMSSFFLVGSYLFLDLSLADPPISCFYRFYFSFSLSSCLKASCWMRRWRVSSSRNRRSVFIPALSAGIEAGTEVFDTPWQRVGAWTLGRHIPPFSRVLGGGFVSLKLRALFCLVIRCHGLGSQRDAGALRIKGAHRQWCV